MDLAEKFFKKYRTRSILKSLQFLCEKKNNKPSRMPAWKYFGIKTREFVFVFSRIQALDKYWFLARCDLQIDLYQERIIRRENLILLTVPQTNSVARKDFLTGYLVIARKIKVSHPLCTRWKKKDLLKKQREQFIGFEKKKGGTYKKKTWRSVFVLFSEGGEIVSRVRPRIFPCITRARVWKYKILFCTVGIWQRGSVRYQVAFFLFFSNVRA